MSAGPFRRRAPSCRASAGASIAGTLRRASAVAPLRIRRDLRRALALQIGGDRGDRIEVLRNDLGVAHLDREIALQERHEFQDAGGIHHAVLEQRVAVGKTRHILAEQEVLFDEGPHAAQEPSFVHLPSPRLRDFLAGRVLNSSLRRPARNASRQSCVDRIPVNADVVAEAAGASGEGLRRKLLHRLSVEDARRGDGRAGKESCDVVRRRRRAEEGSAVRRAVGLLRPLRHRRAARDRAPASAQDVLLGEPAKLQTRRHLRRHLHDAVVEEGEAALRPRSPSPCGRPARRGCSPGAGRRFRGTAPATADASARMRAAGWREARRARRSRQARASARRRRRASRPRSMRKRGKCENSGSPTASRSVAKKAFR